MKTAILSLCITCSLIFGLNAQPSQYDPQTYLISFEKGTSEIHIDEVMEDLNSTEVWVSPLSETRLWKFNDFPILITMPDGTSYIAEDILQGQTGVHAHRDDDDSLVGGGLNELTDAKYSITTGGPLNPTLPCLEEYRYFLKQGTKSSVKVAIVDSGVQQEINGSTTYPFDPIIYNIKDYLDGTAGGGVDQNNHGTHLLSIMNFVAEYHDPESSSNVSYDVRRILDAENTGSLADLIYATEEALVAGANIVNLSLSFYDADGTNEHFVKILIDEVEELNALLVVSAGNNSDNLDITDAILPASLQSPNLVTVGALYCNRKLTDFSNFGLASVDIATAGENVAGYDRFGNIVNFDGTSQAAAIVSGLSALLGTYQSTFDGQAIKCALIEGSRPASTLNGKIFSEGFVDAIRSKRKVVRGCETIYGDGGPGEARSIESDKFLDSDAFPNPFTNVINLNLNKGTYKIQVSNTQGKIMFSQNIISELDGEVHSLDLSSLANNAIHFITILNDAGEQTVHKVFRR